MYGDMVGMVEDLKDDKQLIDFFTAVIHRREQLEEQLEEQQRSIPVGL